MLKTCQEFESTRTPYPLDMICVMRHTHTFAKSCAMCKSVLGDCGFTDLHFHDVSLAWSLATRVFKPEPPKHWYVTYALFAFSRHGPQALARWVLNPHATTPACALPLLGLRGVDVVPPPAGVRRGGLLPLLLRPDQVPPPRGEGLGLRGAGGLAAGARVDLPWASAGGQVMFFSNNKNKIER